MEPTPAFGHLERSEIMALRTPQGAQHRNRFTGGEESGKGFLNYSNQILDDPEGTPSLRPLKRIRSE
jgi:hypothetical protein